MNLFMSDDNTDLQKLHELRWNTEYNIDIIKYAWPVVQRRKHKKNYSLGI